MADKLQADELASRCLALIVFGDHKRWRKSDVLPLSTVIRDVAMEARRLGIRPGVIIDEVMAGLQGYYGPTKATWYRSEIVAGFFSDGPPPLPSPR